MHLRSLECGWDTSCCLWGMLFAAFSQQIWCNIWSVRWQVYPLTLSRGVARHHFAMPTAPPLVGISSAKMGTKGLSLINQKRKEHFPKIAADDSYLLFRSIEDTEVLNHQSSGIDGMSRFEGFRIEGWCDGLLRPLQQFKEGKKILSNWSSSKTLNSKLELEVVALGNATLQMIQWTISASLKNCYGFRKVLFPNLAMDLISYTYTGHFLTCKPWCWSFIEIFGFHFGSNHWTHDPYHEQNSGEKNPLIRSGILGEEFCFKVTHDQSQFDGDVGHVDGIQKDCEYSSDVDLCFSGI